MLYSSVNIQYAREESANIAAKAYELAKAKTPFALVLSKRTVYFDPTAFICVDMPSKQAMKFISLQAMMVEVSGLCFVAKDIITAYKRNVIPPLSITDRLI